MIVEEITLAGWRSYREARTFRFGEKVTLLVGPNEAGKSTLLEALQRALFDRHNGTSEEIKALQPVGTSLAPEVTVVFRVNGGRYRVTKRFLREARSELCEEVGGTFSRIADGDAADERTLAMAGGTFPGRGASKPVHRGLAEALWYLQRETAVPEQEWNEGVQRGLSGLIQLSVRSPIEEAVVAAVEREHEQAFTPTGREKKGQLRGELSMARERLTKLSTEIEALRGKLEAMRGARAALERLEIEKAEKARELLERMKELEAERKTLEASGELGQAKAIAEAARGQSEERLSQLRTTLQTLCEKRDRFEKLGQELQDLTALEGTRQTELRAEESATSRARKARCEERVPALRLVEAELEQLTALERRRTLAKDIERLDTHVRRLGAAKKEMDRKQLDLANLRAPTKAEWVTFQELVTQTRIKEGEARAASIRVGIQLQKKGLKVSTKPVARNEGDEYLVVEPTTFELEGIARIHMRALGESLQQLNQELGRLRKETASTLSRFGVADEAALAASYAQRESLEREVKELKRKFKDIGDQEPNAEVELVKSRRGLDEEEAKLSGLSPERREWGGEKIRGVISTLKTQKKDIIRDIDNLEAEEKRAGDRVQVLLRESVEARASLSRLKAIRDQLERESEGILSEFGSLKRLEDEIIRAGQEVESRRKAAERISKEYEEKVVAPQKRAHTAEKAANSLSDRVNGIEREMAGHEREIQVLTQEGIYTAEADRSAELEYLRSRISVLERRAEAIKLLRAVLEKCQESRTLALTQPIRDILDPWFKELTGGAYDGVEIGPDLLPATAVRNNGLKMPAPWMSYGTYEQVMVLVRLAMGVLAGKADRQTVVLDDRLVNADAVRSRRLAAILSDAGTKCQVLLATCNDAPYAGTDAQVVQVPAGS